MASVQAAGGAKNHLIIMPDADLEQAAKAIQAAAFGCAGERCMAGSVAVPVGGIAVPLVASLCEKASKMSVGPTDGDARVDMGPVISREHLDKVKSYLDIGKNEGANLALDGRRSFKGDGFLVGPSVLDHVTPGMRVAKEEIFGPVLSVVRAKTLDDALALGRDCPYGAGFDLRAAASPPGSSSSTSMQARSASMSACRPPIAWFPFRLEPIILGDLHIQVLKGRFPRQR